MTISTDQVNKIYELLGDEESREVFSKRLMYTLVPTPRNIRELLRINLPDFIDAVHRFTENGDKVCVYGAGNIMWYPGRPIAYCFQDVLAGIYDRNADELGKIDFFGLKLLVQKPEAIKELGPDIVVIVATATQKYQQEIFKTLLSYGIPQHRILFIPPLYHLTSGEYFDWPFFKVRP